MCFNRPKCVLQPNPPPINEIKSSFDLEESGSNEGDRASDRDEWQPSPPPTASCLLSESNSTRLSPTTPSNVLTGELSAYVKASNVGALMEIETPEEQYPRRHLENQNSAKPAAGPEDDRYLYCHKCECMVINACEEHPIMWIENVVVDDCDATPSGDINLCTCSRDGVAHAKKTAPEEYVFVGRSSIPSAGLGVWSEKEIPLGTIFGPYGGEIVYLDALSPEELEIRSRRGYAWLVRENLMGSKSHLVDAANPVASNWLRFVNCARSEDEQTLATIQYCGKIYYRACQNIRPNVELLTFYGEKFARELGIVTADEIPVISPSGARKVGLSHRSSKKWVNPSVHNGVSSLPRWQRCPICRERFSLRRTLNHHISTVHYDLRAYTCEVCDKDFAEEKSLKRHIDTVHKKIREFRCDFCGKAFGQRGNLKLHVDSIHKELREYTCEICGRAFSIKANLQTHIDALHKNLREFPCDVCGKAFARKGNLKAHIDSIHKKLRDYTCDICGRAFTQKGTLNRHVAGVHKKTSED
ncbi:Histone-lysine N-methyltransferase prdm9 [Sparganum proliferum]